MRRVGTRVQAPGVAAPCESQPAVRRPHAATDGALSAQALSDHLFEDPCFLAAEKVLARQVKDGVLERSRNNLLSRIALPQSATLPLPWSR